MDYFVVCIGNREGGDDTIGPYIADRLIDQDFENVIDCGIIPENYTGVIKEKNPKKVVIIDAVDMSIGTGEIRIIHKDKIGVMTISTHGIPLSVFINYLEQYISNIIFIGIQPEKMSGSMTKKVKESAEKLVDLLKNDNIEKIKAFD